MGIFKSDIPPYTGDNDTDIKGLRDWACRLVDELRHLFYDLDSINVKSVKGESVKGIIPVMSLPVLPTVRLKSGVEKGMLFTNEDGSVLARICFNDTDNSICINIEGGGKLYLNGSEITAGGGAS